MYWRKVREMPISLQTLKCYLTLIIQTKVSSALLGGEEEGLALISRSVEEAVEGSEATIEDLDFLDRGRGLHLQCGTIWLGLASIPS